MQAFKIGYYINQYNECTANGAPYPVELISDTEVTLLKHGAAGQILKEKSRLPVVQQFYESMVATYEKRKHHFDQPHAGNGPILSKIYRGE